jgi:hypothetical protein
MGLWSFLGLVGDCRFLLRGNQQDHAECDQQHDENQNCLLLCLHVFVSFYPFADTPKLSPGL